MLEVILLPVPTFLPTSVTLTDVTSFVPYAVFGMMIREKYRVGVPDLAMLTESWSLLFAPILYPWITVGGTLSWFVS